MLALFELLKTLLSKLLWFLPGFVLKWFFSEVKCRQRIRVHLAESNFSFYINPELSNHSMSGVTLTVYDLLPVPVTVSLKQVAIQVHHCDLGIWPLHATGIIRPYAFATLRIPEVSLSGQNTAFLQRGNDRHVFVKCDGVLQCESRIRKFEANASLESIGLIFH